MEPQLSLFGFGRNGQTNFYMERIKEIPRQSARLALKIRARHSPGPTIRANYQL